MLTYDFVFQALQLSGSILVVLHCMSTNWDSVLRRFSGSGYLELKLDNTVDYDDDDFENYFRNAYLNKIALVFLIAGFVLEPGAAIYDGDWPSKVILLLITCAAWALLASVVAEYALMIKNPKSRRIEKSDLNRLKIKPHSVEESNVVKF